MIQSIEQYLSLLKKELSGCDRATIQDALSDTEGHLSMAFNSTMADGNITESDALAQVIEKYGMPEEVAKAYREIENRIAPALSQASHADELEKTAGKDEQPFLRRFFGIFADSRAWGACLYLLFSLATGIIYFTWAVTGISLSVGLMVLIIGLPFAGLFILSVRGIGLVEGLIVEALLGVRMPRRPLFYRKNMGWWQNFKAMVSDKHTWLSLVYMILQLPLGIIYFTVLITLIAVSLYGIALPILQLGFDLPVSYVNGVTYYLVTWMLPLTVIAGILLATLTMHLARYLGRQHGALAKALLVRS
ncbi:sensor domain-containing protein [Chloroflexota bacterium]